MPTATPRSVQPLTVSMSAALPGRCSTGIIPSKTLISDFETGGQITVLAGKRLGPLRVEAEIASQGAEFDPSNSRFDGDIYIGRFTASAYVDITNIDVSWIKGGITPYLGGGAGIAVVDVESVDDDDEGFTAHGEAGFSFPIHKRVEIVPAYRYEWADFDDFDRNHRAHTIRVGGRYNF